MTSTRTFTCGTIELTAWLSDDTDTCGIVIVDSLNGTEYHHTAPTFEDYVDQLRQLESFPWVEMLPPCDSCGQNANNLETHGMVSCLPCHERAMTETFQTWLYGGEDICADGIRTLEEAMESVTQMMADAEMRRYFPILVMAVNEYGDERRISRITLLEGGK